MIDTSHANTMTALNALKAYETKDTVLMKKCIGDSITFSYDGGVFKGTNAQFVKMAATMSTGITTKIKVDDWEAVVGKDVKKHEWVSIWYTQYNTDMKGKKDSVEYLNDMLIKNGKIIKLDEYARHFKMPGK